MYRRKMLWHFCEDIIYNEGEFRLTYKMKPAKIQKIDKNELTLVVVGYVPTNGDNGINMEPI